MLPLGDSITLGVPHTYRYALARALSERGQEVDFVGSVQGSDGIYPDGWDQDHEGHSGWSVGDIDAELEGWLRGYTADVALVHLGTNDVAAVREGEISLAESEASMRGIVAKLRAQNPRVAIVLAQILPYGGEFASFNATVDDWNRRLVVLASALTTADSPVSVVDMNTGFGEGDLDEDGIHPSAAGAARMAGVWADALR
ncbi:MAG: SGNH/GDSL hydrolase family protein [Myxococcota bacterium]